MENLLEAKVQYHPNRIELLLPFYLEDINKYDLVLYEHLFVYCFITKEKIMLSDLYYWDIDKQIAFKSYLEVHQYINDSK